MRFTYKESKEIKRKREGKYHFKLNITSIVIGIAVLIDIPVQIGVSSSEVITDIVIGSIFLLLGARGLIKNTAKKLKWDKYESYIDNQGNTSISYLSKRTGYPTDRIRLDLQEMIRSHFFTGANQDRDAYIDGNRDLLVMVRWPEETPFVDPEYSIKREKEAKKEAGENPDVLIMRKAISSIKDEKLKESISDMEGSIKRIEQKLEENPELKENQNIKRLKEFYLPQTINLIETLEEGEISPQTEKEIKKVLEDCAEAFRNIEKEFLEKNDLEAMVDVEVLKQTLTKEGLLDSDFKI